MIRKALRTIRKYEDYFFILGVGIILTSYLVKTLPAYRGNGAIGGEVFIAFDFFAAWYLVKNVAKEILEMFFEDDYQIYSEMEEANKRNESKRRNEMHRM